MNTCALLKRTHLLALLLAVVACAFGIAPSAWASDDESPLAPDSGAVLTDAEGQDGVLASSWRYENGLPIDDTALSDQGELTDQAAPKTHFGIDVSVWQGDINWSKVAGSVDFAIIRCGYGSNYASQDDKRWLANAKGCKNAGIPMGVYLYSYATNTSMARSEAMHVVRCLREAGLKESDLALPIYLDMEDSSTIGSNYVAIFEAFRSTLAENGYANVGVYANCNWWRNYLSGISLDSSLRWVAHWHVSDPFSSYEDLRSKGYGVWQYSSEATVPGISGTVDGNYLNDNVNFHDGMRRLYNPNSGEHFYTQSTKEMIGLVKAGWRYEGTGWHAPSSSSTPVYRLYNPNAGDHHYTTSAEERDQLVEEGWNDEGIGWYSDDAESTPVYRLYNPNAKAGAHHYTTSAKERDGLVKKGWQDEGVGWYAL